MQSLLLTLENGGGIPRTMKKLLAGFLVAGILGVCVPVITNAQVGQSPIGQNAVGSSSTDAEIHAQLEALLAQLIQLVTQLQAQLAAQQDFSVQGGTQEEIQVESQANKRQESLNTLTREYNRRVAAFDQKIVEIKKKYLADVEAVRNESIPLEFINGRIQKLTDEANWEIQKTQLEKQQAQNEYDAKVETLD